MAEAKLLNGMKLAGQVGSSGKRSMRTYTLVWQKPSYPTPRTPTHVLTSNPNPRQ